MTPDSVNFINEKIKFELKGKLRIKKWIVKTIVTEKQQPGALNFIFCNDSFLLEINKKYLQHNYYTDIITFDYTEQADKKTKIVSGDVFISIDRVKENAKGLGITFDNELKRVMIHGVLHLIGYADKAPADKKKMRKKEDNYLKQINKI